MTKMHPQVTVVFSASTRLSVAFKVSLGNSTPAYLWSDYIILSEGSGGTWTHTTPHAPGLLETR